MEGSAISDRGKRGSEGNTKGRSLGVGVVRGERKIIKKEGFKKKNKVESFVHEAPMM